MNEPVPMGSDALESPLQEHLLSVHSAPTIGWLADTAATGAERGLGALYGLLYVTDASGQLVGVRPASGAQRRALARLSQVLDADMTALRLDPEEKPSLAAALREGHAVAVRELDAVLSLEAERLQAAQRELGVNTAWLAPLHGGGESSGLLLLLIADAPPSQLAQAELLAKHVAVALSNLRERDAGRKRGEVDAVRWVFDERRFREELAHEARRAQRHQRPLSILILRVFNLEELRARYGRFLAERVLRQVAGRLDDTMRDTDFLGASAHDGFAAILVEADQKGAERAEERLSAGLHAMTPPNTDLPDLKVEIACATATQPQDGESAEELMAAAEARLSQGQTTYQDVASAG